MLTKLLEGSAKDELDSRGISPTDIGTHSLRKGSSSYSSSGSTACPSAVAVHLRAGWNVGGVTDRYLRYEGAGDMYVGRTVCGLPITHAEFAILPPHFTERNLLINQTITECFANLADNMHQVAEFTLASVVFHREYLVNNLPQNHLLFYTPLFTNWRRMKELSNLVDCHLPKANDVLKATGVPPHIMQLNKIKEISDNISKIIPAIEKSTKDAIAGLVNVLEERAIGANTVTYEGLSKSINNTLTSVLKDTGLLDLVNQNQVQQPKNKH